MQPKRSSLTSSKLRRRRIGDRKVLRAVGRDRDHREAGDERQEGIKPRGIATGAARQHLTAKEKATRRCATRRPVEGDAKWLTSCLCEKEAREEQARNGNAL